MRLKTYASLLLATFAALSSHAQNAKDPADSVIIKFDGTLYDKDGERTMVRLSTSKEDQASIHVDLMVHRFPYHACVIGGQARLRADGAFVLTDRDDPGCELEIRSTADAVEINDKQDRCRMIHCGFSGSIGKVVVPRQLTSSSNTEVRDI